MLIRKVEFIKQLNLSKPGVRRTFIFVERTIHLANYQIHRTSEFIEISNSWKPQIHRTLGPSFASIASIWSENCLRYVIKARAIEKSLSCITRNSVH